MIRIFTRTRDYFDVRAREKQPRQQTYDTGSLGKLQDACCNAHAHVQRTSEAQNVPSCSPGQRSYMLSTPRVLVRDTLLPVPEGRGQTYAV